MISVLTCKRVAGNYVQETLNSIEDAQLNEKKLLVCQGELPDIKMSQIWMIHKVPLLIGTIDNKFSGWETIKTAYKQKEDLLFLEDDIRPINSDSIQKMVNYVVPEWAAFTSFFHPIKTPRRYPAKEFLMSQAVLIPFRSMKWLIEGPEVLNGDWACVRGFDEALSHFASLASWE